MTSLGGGRFLVIERDNEQGEAASFKKVYLIDLNRVNSNGSLVKEEVLDLLSIQDPNLISLPPRDEGDIGLGDLFSFPFQAIESVLPLGDGRLLLLNDNNYPLSAGRNPNQPDDTEAIIIRSKALSDAVVAPAARMPGTGGLSPATTAGLTLLLAAAILGITVRTRRH